jgi:hypothetical protein
MQNPFFSVMWNIIIFYAPGLIFVCQAFKNKLIVLNGIKYDELL